MTLVLDTHVLVWLLDGDRRLGPAARELIRQASTSTDVAFSAISAREIAALVSVGRLTFDRDVLAWLDAARRLPGIRMVPLSVDVSVDSTRLPGDMHGDPADRLIAATARRADATLVTADRALLAYGHAGHVRVAPAGD